MFGVYRARMGLRMSLRRKAQAGGGREAPTRCSDISLWQSWNSEKKGLSSKMNVQS